MADRLTDIVVGLKRLGEGAHQRCEDLEYTQREERHELIHYIDQLLAMTDTLRRSLLEDRKRLVPVERERVQQLHQAASPETIPRVVKQGPAG